MRKITAKWLTKLDACCSDEEKKEAEAIGDIKKIIDKLIKADRLDDANWLITRYMKKMQRVEYAIFAARQVLHIFEEKYPGDNSPRLAIEAAEKYLKSPTRKNKAAAADAYAAAADAYAAAAAYAADAAAYAAYAAAADAYAAADAADAADADAAAYATARKQMQIKILKNGLKIIYRN